MRQREPSRTPRSIPDALWDELFAAMGNDRDRSLLAFYVSCGARASELLGLGLEHVDSGGATLARASVNGVNVDEEMVDLVKFQHSYDAAARVISMADDMLDTIINRMGAGR